MINPLYVETTLAWRYWKKSLFVSTKHKIIFFAKLQFLSWGQLMKISFSKFGWHDIWGCLINISNMSRIHIYEIWISKIGVHVSNILKMVKNLFTEWWVSLTIEICLVWGIVMHSMPSGGLGWRYEVAPQGLLFLRDYVGLSIVIKSH